MTNKQLIEVLLILAGVTIATLTGDNGILTQAQKAKEETERVEKEEENTLNDYEKHINNAIGDVLQVEEVLEGSGTEQNPFVINSIEDLVAFADSVTNGNTYRDQYIKLGLSLDFKSNKSYADPDRTNLGRI